MELTERVRVVFVIDFLYGLHGGTENQLVKLVKNLDRKIYDIHLVCLRNSCWVDEHASELNCRIKCFDMMKLKKPKSMVLVFPILMYMKMIKPDVVMTFFPLSNVLGVAIARMAGVKCIVSTRRDYGLWLGRGLFLLRFANRLVKRILTNSYKVRELTSNEEHFHHSRIDVIYNGISVNGQLPDEIEKRGLKARHGIPEGVAVVGIVGGLKPMKRHATFIRAARRILEGRSDVHFLIVGDGPLRKSLEALASQLGIGDKVHFAGTQENVIPFIGILDVGINCSANEGLSNAIMEYMAYGVPCIVSRAGGNEELISDGENGYLFELDNNAQLAGLMVGLLDDKETRARFAHRSREKIMTMFSLDRMVEQYNEYFAKLLHVR